MTVREQSVVVSTALDATEETESILREWRTRALNVILTVLTLVALPALVTTVLETIRGQEKLSGLLYVASYLFLVGLAVLRRLDIRLRGWGFLLMGYAVGVLGLMRSGLVGSGRVYLMALPVLAIILIGAHSGWIATVLSLLLYAVFGALAHLGILGNWLTVFDNPLDLTNWTAFGTTLVMLLVPIVVLLERFHRLQVNTLVAERQTAGELARINERLEQKVAQRTAELERAVQQAQAASRAKSAFLANMSHELRTPLNAIIGFTRLVKRRSGDVLPQKQIENLEKVLTSAKRLLEMINAVLDLSKIEAGLVDVRPVNFDVAELVRACLQTVRPLADAKQLRVVEEIDLDLPPLLTDQGKVRQILINLLSNAVKFTEAGSVTIRVQRRDETLTLAVVDTGVGIPEQESERIFDAFRQVDDSTTRRYGGTGLGLSISRRLARLLGGDLTVESAVGVGSTFTIILPIRYEVAPPATAAAPGCEASFGATAVQSEKGREDASI